MSEIAGSPRINVSTAHRLLRTPTRRGYAEQNPDTRSYARGPRHLELGSAYAGHHEPAHCAAIGTVQLAFLPEQGFERFVERGPLVVPVSRPSGRANAAISIAMPKARFQPENVAGWVRLLNETATRISRALGLSTGGEP